MITNKFEECIEYITQPQKRAACMSFHELTAAQSIYLKHNLVKWHPPNSECRARKGEYQPPFPWEYIDLNDELKLSGLTHELTQIRVPRYFSEESIAVSKRNSTIVKHMETSHKKILIVDDIIDSSGQDALQEGSNNAEYSASVENHLISRTNSELHMKDFKQKENDPPEDSTGAEYSKSSGICGIVKNDVEHQREIMNFRKSKQKDNEMKFRRGLSETRSSLQEVHGFLIQRELTDARVDWVTRLIGDGKEVPDNLDSFYEKTNEVCKGESDIKPKEDKKSKEKQGKKQQEKTDNTGDTTQESPSFETKTECTVALRHAIDSYQQSWAGAEIDPASSFDIAAMRANIRKEIEVKITEEVDKDFANKLKQYKVQTETKKNVKAKKKTGKACKAKKDKKKGKSLPGLKCADIKKMDIEQMLSCLVEHGIVRFPQQKKIDDLKGGFNLSGSERSDYNSSQVRYS